MGINYWIRPDPILSDVDPVEWCVLLPDGADSRGGAQTVCIFYETPDRALYILDPSRGGYRFNFGSGTAWGVPGPVPKIDDGPVDFGIRLKREIRIKEITPTSLHVQSIQTDGTTTFVEREFYWKLDKNRQSFSGSPRGYEIIASRIHRR